MTSPRNGAMKMNAPIFSSPPTTRAFGPACTSAAPESPPTSACEELAGNPHHHVRRSQTIAPTSPAVTTASVMYCGSTVPLPIVFATCNPKKRKAMKLKNAAQTTAARGDSTRVETTVAIEFAASWKPLMKSNERASAMIDHTTQGSDILQNDPFDDVGHVLAAVRRGLEHLDDVHPLDDVLRVFAVLEEARERDLLDPVCFVLQPVDFARPLAHDVDAFHVPQHRHHVADQCGRPDEALRQVLRRLDRLVDLEQHDPVHGGVDEIEDVVDAADELVDVLAVERRDEGLVQALDRLVRQFVADVLEVLHLAGAAAQVVEPFEEFDQRAGALVRIAGGLFEQVEEDLFLRDEVEHGGGRSAWRAVRGGIRGEPPPWGGLLAEA